jgi:excisionase family DNA binding protein
MGGKPPAPDGERMYRISEVAELWGLSRDTVERMVRRGYLRWVRIGSVRRIPASALAEYQLEHELEGPPESDLD